MWRRLFPRFVLFALAAAALSAGAETAISPADQLAAASNIASVRWLADGKNVAFLATVDGVSQLWRASADGGEPQQLTKAGDPIIALLPSPTDANLIALQTNVGDAAAPRCSFYDLAKGAAEPIGAAGADCLLGAWSRDGKRFAYSTNQRTPEALDVYVMEIPSREARLALKGDGDLRAAAFSPSGEQLVAQQRETAANQNLLALNLSQPEAKPVLLTPHNGWAVYHAARWPVGPRSARGFFVLSNVARDVARLAYLQVERRELEYQERGAFETDLLDFALNGVTMAIADNMQGLSRLGVQDVASGKWLPPPKLSDGVLRDLAVSPRGERLALIYATPMQPSELYVAATPTGETARLTKLGADAASASWVAPRFAPFRAADGRMIPAFLYLPKIAEGQKAPLAILAPREVGEQHRPGFQPFVQFLVKQGFAVLAVNVRGSAGFGKDHFYLDDRAKRADAARDLADAAALLRKAEPRIDPDRIVVVGESYGGLLALEALAQTPDRFQAGVAVSPVLDLEKRLARSAPWGRKLLEAEYGSPDGDRDLLRSLSPANHPERCKTPLLLLGGKRDPLTTSAELAAFAEAVRARGVVADLVAYDDEAHGLRQPRNVADAWTKIAAFLQATWKLAPTAP